MASVSEVATPRDDLITALLPGLARSGTAGFNVFDVMRHGTHEKQISNFFGWLLEIGGSHQLGDLCQRILLEEINRSRPDEERFGNGPYLVRQEVATSDVDEVQDIADLVLDSDQERLVIENYFTSDGHGHSYDRYRRNAHGDGRRGVVVLLCHDEDSSRQSDGWEQASVITYEKVVTPLLEQVPSDYPQKQAESYSFIDQMYRKFVRGRGRVEDQEVLEFLTVMCATGEAGRYRDKSQDTAALKFGDDVSYQAVERFGEARALLQRLKGRLRTYCAQVLQAQLNETMGAGFVARVSATYAGIYQWTISLDVADDEGGNTHEADLQLKFGPSAWHANEQDAYWRQTVDGAHYAHLFLTRVRSRVVRQSAVTMQEVLEGLGDDRRLHDEIVDLWERQAPSAGDPIAGQ